MNKLNKILTGLLVLQLLIAGGIYTGSQVSGPDRAIQTLVSTETDQIDKIIIQGNKGNHVTLSKENKQWLLPDYYQLQADKNSVEKLLKNLSSAKIGWPVATTDSGHARFKVADDQYEFKINLESSGKQVAEIYFGSSPGFRQIHVRPGGADEVYSVKLNSYDFPEESSKWLDKTLLRPEGSITKLKGPGFSIEKKQGQWNLVEGYGVLDKEETDRLISSLNNLSVLEAVDQKVEKENYLLTVEADNKPVVYKFFNIDDKYYISRDGISALFKLNKTTYEKITGMTAEKLVKAISEENKDMTAGDNQEAKRKENS